jgi:hypothetical protein
MGTTNENQAQAPMTSDSLPSSKVAYGKDDYAKLDLSVPRGPHSGRGHNESTKSADELHDAVGQMAGESPQDAEWRRLTRGR